MIKVFQENSIFDLTVDEVVVDIINFVKVVHKNIMSIKWSFFLISIMF